MAKPVPVNRRALIYLYSRLPFLIRRAEQLFTLLYAAQPAARTVTIAQMQCLDILVRHGVLSQAELARASGVDTSTINLIVRNLDRDGLVAQVTDERDKRRKRVSISDSGRQALDDARRAARTVADDMLAPLGPGRARFLALLERVAKTDIPAPAWDLAREEARAREDDGGIGLSVLLRRALQVMDAFASGAMTSVGVTIRQFTFLILIFAHPGITEAELARFGGFDSSNAGFLLKILVNAGLIEIVPNGGSRRRAYRVTTAGWGVMHKAGPSLMRAELSTLGGLAEAEVDEMRHLLVRLLRERVTGPSSTMPLFGELTESDQWPIATQDLDFQTMADFPSDRALPVEFADVLADTEGSSILLLKWIELRMRLELARGLQPLDMSPEQWLVLSLIGSARPMTAADIQDMLGLDAKRLFQLLKALHGRGCTTHDGSGRRRMERLALTDAGARTLRAAQDLVRPIEARLFSRVGRGHQARLGDDLAALAMGMAQEP